MDAPDAEVALIASDGSRVLLPRRVAAHQSLLLRDLLDGSPSTVDIVEVPLDLIDARILQRCVDYMQHRDKAPRARDIPKPLRHGTKLEDVLDEYDRGFVQHWDDSVSVRMVKASCFLNILDLKELTCAKLASMIAERTVEEVRCLLGVESDFTVEEEVALRKELGEQ